MELMKQLEAWQICHDLLTAEGSPLEGRLFSAQTLRAKVGVRYHLEYRSHFNDMEPDLRSSMTSHNYLANSSLPYATPFSPPFLPFHNPLHLQAPKRSSCNYV